MVLLVTLILGLLSCSGSKEDLWKPDRSSEIRSLLFNITFNGSYYEYGKEYKVRKANFIGDERGVQLNLEVEKDNGIYKPSYVFKIVRKDKVNYYLSGYAGDGILNYGSDLKLLNGVNIIKNWGNQPFIMLDKIK